MRTLFVALLLFANGASTFGEEIIFEMSVWGYKFGTMVVSRTVENDSTEVYTVEAKGETDFMWMKRKEESSHRITYVNGRLESSEYVYLNKGEKEKWAYVNYDQGQYTIRSNDGSRTLSEQLIDYSLVKLYFEPSFEKQTVFCEEDCSFSTVTPIPDENIIKIACKDGNRSTYHINDGKVDELEIHLSVATVKLKRIN